MFRNRLPAAAAPIAWSELQVIEVPVQLAEHPDFAKDGALATEFVRRLSTERVEQEGVDPPLPLESPILVADEGRPLASALRIQGDKLTPRREPLRTWVRSSS